MNVGPPDFNICRGKSNFQGSWACVESVVLFSFAFNLKSLKVPAPVVRSEKWRKHSAMPSCQGLFVETREKHILIIIVVVTPPTDQHQFNVWNNLSPITLSMI